MRPITLALGPFAAGNAALFVASATPVSGTPLTLTGAAPDVARRVLLTYGNEGSARTLVLTGTNVSGNTISETLAVPSGAGGTVVSVLDYATVTRALPLGSGWTAAATLGTVTSGTEAPVASSAWCRLDDYGFAPVALGIDATGTINVTVEYSDDDPNNLAPLPVILPAAMAWLTHPVLQSVTTSTSGTFDVKPKFVRLTANSATAGAGNLATLTVIQPGGKGG